MFSLLSRIGALLLFLVLPETLSAVNIPCAGLAGCSTSPDNYIPSLVVVLQSSLSSYIYGIGVLFTLIAGGYLIISGGAEDKISKGKETLLWTIIGIFVANSAFTLSGYLDQEADGLYSGGAGTSSDVISAVLNGYLANPSSAINPIIGLMDIALLGYCLYCGMKMVATRGEDSAYEDAKKGLFYAAVGAVIINLVDLIVIAIIT